MLDEKCEATLGARFAGSMIAINLYQFGHHPCSLENFNENIQRRRNGEATRSHLAADQYIETDPSALASGHQGDVLRLIVSAIVQTCGDGDVEFARQVRELRVAISADEEPIQFLNNRGGVEQFIGGQPCKRAAVDVANVVDAGLQRAKV